MSDPKVLRFANGSTLAFGSSDPAEKYEGESFEYVLWLDDEHDLDCDCRLCHPECYGDDY